MKPPSDREIALCKMFESFCITAIRNYSRNLKRAMKNRQKHDGTGKESVEYLAGSLSTEDKYASEQFVLDVDLRTGERAFIQCTAIPARSGTPNHSL